MKKKYPSQIKYEEENPLICFRVKKEIKNRIVNMTKKSKKSISRLVSMNMLDLEIDFSKAIAETEKDVYEQAKNDWALWHYCNVCDEIIYIQPNSDAHNAIIEFMKQHGWGHPECHKQQ